MIAAPARFLLLSVVLHGGLLAYLTLDSAPHPAGVKPLMVNLSSFAPPSSSDAVSPAAPRPSPSSKPRPVPETVTTASPGAAPTAGPEISTAPVSVPSAATLPENLLAATREESVPPARDDQALQQRLQARLRDALAPYFVYPSLARRQGWQGEVTVALRVETDGRLSGIHLIASSGHGIIDRDALRTLQDLPRLDHIDGWLENKHFDMVLPIEYRLTDS